MPDTPVAKLHSEFCSEFHSTWFDEFVLVNVPSATSSPPPSSVWLGNGDTSRLLVQTVKRHFDKVHVYNYTANKVIIIIIVCVDA